MRKIGGRTTKPGNRIGLTLIGHCGIHQVTWFEKKKNMAAQIHNASLTGLLKELLILADILYYVALFAFMSIF